ncbi:MAG: ABC transporter ATP-binding protein [Christensenellales bacterium]|jgi:ABC-2 type transport system ATP-binding protein
MLSIQNVSKSYAKSGVKAVDNLNLGVKPGEIFGFIGPNGAGKTTTIKMMTGILMPDAGSITINGHDMQKDPLAAKQSIGFVPDTHEIYDALKGIEYLNFMADMYGVNDRDKNQRMEKYLHMLELSSAVSEPIKSYSHGMKQKLTIIGALLHDPALWVLDEPLTGLDPKSSHLLKTSMQEHCSRGNTVFFSTHILEVAERLCHRIGIIAEGKLVAVGTLDELRSNRLDASLENIFLEITDKEDFTQEAL